MTEGKVGLAPLEVAGGWVFGIDRGTVGPLARLSSARLALEQVILPALQHPPCYVSFSGGRDSSAVLAIAALHAQREGLAAPVAVTEVYPDHPEVDESYWQELVIARLPVEDWIRVEVHDEDDLLGESAREGLLRRGLLWPPSVQTKSHFFSHLCGGTVLTGEGGDEVFGARRIRLSARLVHRDDPVRPATVRSALASAAPGRLRERQIGHELRSELPQQWLRPAARDEYFRLMARDLASEPLGWLRSLLWLSRRRAYQTLTRSHQRVAAEYGVTVVDPLLDPAYLAALGSTGRRFGYGSRTEAMRAEFRDVLPDEILARQSKASFSAPHWGPGVQEFVKNWDGLGVDTDLVDPDALHREWLSTAPSPGSKMLLHASWLETVGQSARPLTDGTRG